MRDGTTGAHKLRGLASAPLLDSPLKSTKLARDVLSRMLVLQAQEEVLGGRVGLFFEPRNDLGPRGLKRVFSGPVGSRWPFFFLMRGPGFAVFPKTRQLFQKLL